jgi:hypothetical protein
MTKAKLVAAERNTLPTHVHQVPKLTLSREARQSMGKYVERQKLPGEAKAPENDLWKRKNYKTGDGDTGTYVPRPGSLVAFTLPSRGLV